jgi:hypothetical protein
MAAAAMDGFMMINSVSKPLALTYPNFGRQERQRGDGKAGVEDADLGALLLTEHVWQNR